MNPAHWYAVAVLLVWLPSLWAHLANFPADYPEQE